MVIITGTVFTTLIIFLSINPALYPHFHSEDTDAPDEEPEVPDDVIDQEDNFEIFDTDETGDEEIEEDLLVHI